MASMKRQRREVRIRHDVFARCVRARAMRRARSGGCRDCDGVVDLEMMCARIRARLVVRRDHDAASEGASDARVCACVY